MGIPKDYLPARPTGRLRSFAMMDVMPERRLAIIVKTIATGASIRHAANKAGLAFDEVQYFLWWGKEGLQPWEEFYEQVKRAMGEVGAQLSSVEFGHALNGDPKALERWMKRCDPEEARLAFAEPEDAGGGGGGVMNLNVNLTKHFEPGGRGRALPPGEVVDAEYEEN